MNPYDQIAFKLAADHFLCDSLPENYFELDQELQYQFLSENAWWYYEGTDPEFLEKRIENVARGMKLIAEGKTDLPLITWI